MVVQQGHLPRTSSPSIPRRCWSGTRIDPEKTAARSSRPSADPLPDAALCRCPSRRRRPLPLPLTPSPPCCPWRPAAGELLLLTPSSAGRRAAVHYRRRRPNLLPLAPPSPPPPSATALLPPAAASQGQGLR